ncbi:response regulator [candidate division KSB1 bacterium]|nr:response regulator [candidate division KSB1 bacterium]
MKRHKILIVDDEEYILWSLERLLEDEYTVFTADNARGGLQILAQETIEVIISDQRMPGMTGVEFLGTVRKTNSCVVTFLITCYDETEIITRALKNGIIDRFIQKAWKPTSLLTELEKAVQLYEVRLKTIPLPTPASNSK